MKSATLLLIATGRYKQFVPILYEDILNKWLTDVPERQIVLCTDVTTPEEAGVHVSKVPVHIVPIVRRGFPGDTLFRYHYFLKCASLWKDTDFAMYMDVDMRILRPFLASELFGSQSSHLYVGSPLHANLQSADHCGQEWQGFAVVHPGFANNAHSPWGTPETSPFSESCLPQGPRRMPYVCGGVQGGRSLWYLQAMQAMVGRIDRDLARHHTPIWHDESVWNRYVHDESRMVRLFTPSLCHSLTHSQAWGLNVWVPIITTIEKDHHYFRGA
jgi:hypothetical protein